MANFTDFTRSMAQFLHANQRKEVHIWSTVMGCLCYFGAISSILVLIVAWPKYGSRSGFTIVICHAIGLNLAMCLVGLPGIVFLDTAGVDSRWIPPNFCTYVRPLYSLIGFAINWCDAELAINRLLALFFPYHYRKLTSRPANIFLIVLAWICSLISGVGPFALVSVDKVIGVTKLGQCTWNATAAGKFGEFGLWLSVIIPYSISGLGAVLILFKTCLLTWHWTGDGAAPSRALQHRLKMAKMLLVTFLWTAICISPTYIGTLVFGSLGVQNPSAALWLRIANALQYGLTPGLMLASNDDYRKRLREVCCLRIRSRRILGVNSTKPISNTGQKHREPVL